MDLKIEVLRFLIPSIILLLLNTKSVWLNKYFEYISLSILILVHTYINTSATQHISGIDNYVYRLYYIRVLQGIDASPHGDIGFDIFSKILAWLDAPILIFFFLVAFTQIIIMHYFIKKYSKNWRLAFIFYILMFYFQFNFNVIRQALAISLSLLFMHNIIENKKIKAIIFMLIAISFHKSAILVPILLIIITKLKVKVSKRLVVSIFLISQSLSPMINRVVKKNSFLFPTQYQNYSEENFFTDYRFTITYFLYLFFLMILFLLITNVYKNKKNILNTTFLNPLLIEINYFGFFFLFIFSIMIIFRILAVTF